MSAPTQLLPITLIRDLQVTLAVLRMARELNPRHELIPGADHTRCDICNAQTHLDQLCDKLPRPITEAA